MKKHKRFTVKSIAMELTLFTVIEILLGLCLGILLVDNPSVPFLILFGALLVANVVATYFNIEASLRVMYGQGKCDMLDEIMEE